MTEVTKGVGQRVHEGGGVRDPVVGGKKKFLKKE